VTQAASIAEDKSYLKIQTVILICNAKGIPNAIARETVRQKLKKTVVLKVYA